MAQEANLGTYEFEQLPTMGDHLNIDHANGRVRHYRVLCLAHEPTGTGSRCPLIVTAHADFNVSGDSDLLDLSAHPGIPNVTPVEAVAIIDC